MSRYTVEQGSIYAPGWHIYEELEPRHYRSLGCFDNQSDAEEYLEHIIEQETTMMTIGVTHNREDETATFLIATKHGVSQSTIAEDSDLYGTFVELCQRIEREGV